MCKNGVFIMTHSLNSHFNIHHLVSVFDGVFGLYLTKMNIEFHCINTLNPEGLHLKLPPPLSGEETKKW